MMKNLTQIAAIVLFAIFSHATVAQKGAAVAPSNFQFALSAEFYSLVSPNATLSNMTDGWSEAASYDETAELKESNPVAYFNYMAKTKMLEKTKKTFKEKLDIEIKPLETLKGKISYNGSFPSEAKAKKVLKNAPGEEYYISYRVDMFKGGVGVGPAGVSLGGNFKPTTTITLTIFNAKGKELQEFEIKEKTDIVVGKTKASVGNVEIGDGMDPDVVLERTLTVYENALNELVADYLKDNKKAYK
ncbi:hypothetical protein [Marinoscillum furvescens]|uniref:DUF3313 domain-containing protein n=1 Tax=Marinoscillum furvescens DSM 4134 TaxID=1122208 RepID=A0A3D9L5J3_MARFU|nr:hypothetical protein [Marinoscillum furvescens]REE00546.1 hypothetical protein C7460_105172 [Marinoscillum furvescens DSM 4134]